MIPVNASGVPIGEIPFVRSGLLGFVGPVSRTVYLQYSVCGHADHPENHCSVYFNSNNEPSVYLSHCTGQSYLCGGED